MCHLHHLVALGALALALAPPCAMAAADPAPAGSEGSGDAPEARADGSSRAEETRDDEEDWTHFEMPAFPGMRPQDALRLHVQSGFAPNADVGSGEVVLYQPEVRGRLTVPIGTDFMLRIAAIGGMDRYAFHGDPFEVGGSSLFGDSLKAYHTRFTLQGAQRLNTGGGSLLLREETWSLLGGFEIGSAFERGAFADGLSGRIGLALGYEVGGLSAAAGAAVATSVDDGGVDVSPIGSLRWDVTDDLTVRDRGLGMQIEYRVTRRLELFVSGFRSTDAFRLRDTGGFEDLTLRDRQVRALAGFEWRATPHFRIYTEAGAIAWRKMRVHADDDGTIVSHHGDPSAFVELRLEVRP